MRNCIPLAGKDGMLMPTLLRWPIRVEGSVIMNLRADSGVVAATQESVAVPYG